MALAQHLKFAIFGNSFQNIEYSFITQLFNCLYNYNAIIYVEKDYFEFIQNKIRIDIDIINTFESLDMNPNFVISVGGDGTLLRTAGKVIEKGIPIIGVNAGRLGFLADTLPEFIEEAINSVYNNNYIIENHSALQITTLGEALTTNQYALNDIAILKRDNASMISIDTFVDEEHLINYQSDGLIVSSPTGSTAYNLSNGGPIVVPNASVFCLTPVAPHSLSVRPIVISDQSKVHLKVLSRTNNYLIAVDGQSQALNQTTEIIINKAPHHIKIVRRCNKHYFAVLKDKMNWGVDKRK